MDVDVYYRAKGAKEVSKFRMFKIDAAEAVAKWPDEYSYTAPKGDVIDKTDPSFMLTAAEDGKPLMSPELAAKAEEKAKDLPPEK